MEDVIAALTAPHRSHGPHHVTANHALVLLLRQLLDQTACLRLVALRSPVVPPVPCPVVLMVRSPLPPALSGRLSLRISSSFLRRLLGRPAWFNNTVSCSSSLQLRLFIRHHFEGLDRSRSFLRLHWFYILIIAIVLCPYVKIIRFIIRFSSSLFLVESLWSFGLSVVVFVVTPARISRSPVRSFRSIC